MFEPIREISQSKNMGYANSSSFPGQEAVNPGLPVDRVDLSSSVQENGVGRNYVGPQQPGKQAAPGLMTPAQLATLLQDPLSPWYRGTTDGGFEENALYGALTGLTTDHDIVGSGNLPPEAMENGVSRNYVGPQQPGESASGLMTPAQLATLLQDPLSPWYRGTTDGGFEENALYGALTGLTTDHNIVGSQNLSPDAME